MRVAILPSGTLLADTAAGDDEAGDGLSVATRGRLTRAFGRGPGHGALQLGAAELDAALSPPLAFLRDIGRAFMKRLCAVPDLEEQRERVDVDCPADERARLAAAAPPMDGSEYVDGDWIGARWAELNRAFADEIRAHRGPVAEWLRARHPSWHAVGKVCLHLAENRGDEAHPFAFLATYVARADSGGKIQHRPLARALEESSARGDRRALLHLLVPLHRAAKQSPWLAELIDSGAIYEAMAWTPEEAHRFVRAVPAFEAAGLVVRVPDWWRRRRPPRPEVTVRVGEKKPSALGMDALLDFSVAVALGGAKLTLEGLRGPAGLAAADPGADFRGTLRPYQKVGVSWLASRRRCGSVSASPTTWASARRFRCWRSCSSTNAAREVMRCRICSSRRHGLVRQPRALRRPRQSSPAWTHLPPQRLGA